MAMAMAKAKSWGFGNGGGGSPFPFPLSSKTPEMRFLNIEVVDDTALIDTSLFDNNKNHLNRNGNGNRNRSRSRMDWQIKNKKAAAAAASAYSRAEMLSLRFRNVHHQRAKWSQVYAALAAPVAAEYRGLLATPFFPNSDAMGKRSSRKISVH